MTSQCAFGGRRVAILGSDGRIVIREKDVLDDIASCNVFATMSAEGHKKTKTFLKYAILLFEFSLERFRSFWRTSWFLSGLMNRRI